MTDFQILAVLALCATAVAIVYAAWTMRDSAKTLTEANESIAKSLASIAEIQRRRNERMGR